MNQSTTIQQLPSGEEVPVLIGKSEAMQSVSALIDQVAPIDVPVFITGESGTGKEVVAKLIHLRSHRASHSFVPVNCGAIPEGLFESEMFGTIRGAYTGADRTRAGLFEQADRGTLLLDEIGEMPTSMQVKLLRVLETGLVTRIGGTDSKHIDFRLISSTNRDLAQATHDDRFRLDLYYRIRAVQIELPPLRERPEDIPALIETFTLRFIKHNHFPEVHWSPAALNWLSEQRWEGNVRELRWFVEGFLSLDRTGGDITPARVQPIFTKLIPSSRRLPILLDRAAPYIAVQEQPYSTTIDPANELRELRREISELKGMLVTALLRIDDLRTKPVVQNELEVFPTVHEQTRTAIERTLHITGGSRREAAKLLGISERTLYRKLKEYDIHTQEIGGETHES